MRGASWLTTARQHLQRPRTMVALYNFSDKPKPAPQVPRPSASVMLLSPTNQLLLLHRVKTSSTFASAHVFPGGNLEKKQEGVPEPGSEHQDSKAYRLGAIREAFEESGILLARAKGAEAGTLIELPEDVREKARKEVHANKVKFADWLESVGAEPDLDGLLPFTRWITPPTVPKRFTTQMYVYMLPLSSNVVGRDAETVVHTPTHDGGLEHTAATFDDVADWLDRQKRGEVMIYPPQAYLLTLLRQFLTGPGDYAEQRAKLVEFLHKMPTGRTAHPTSQISWADKVISPVPLKVKRADGRVALQLHGPGPELKDSTRGGDWDRIVLVANLGTGPKDVEVAFRDDVLAEDKQAKL